MKKIVVVGFAAVIVGVMAAGAAAETGAAIMPASAPAATGEAMPKELAAMIDKGVELLEAGKNAEAIELLMEPKLLAEMKEQKQFDGVVKDFGENKAKELVGILKQARNSPVKLNEDGTKATSDKLGFVKEDGAWHIAGK